MHSIRDTRYVGLDALTQAPGRPTTKHAKLAAALGAAAGLGVLVALLLASLEYVLLGGAIALEPTFLSETATAAANPAVAGGTAPTGQASNYAEVATDYFPGAYPDRGRSGEGNVTTYEHD